METIFFERTSEIRKSKEELERNLNVAIIIKGKIITFEGSPLDEYTASIVLDAMSLGFSAKKALLLKDPEMSFIRLNIKDFTKRKNLQDVRARLIGTEGKTKRAIENIADCDIVLQGNTLGIISPAVSVDETLTAIINLIRGSKQSNVYRFLEDMNRYKKLYEGDLGLKPEKKTGFMTKKKKA